MNDFLSLHKNSTITDNFYYPNFLLRIMLETSKCNQNKQKHTQSQIEHKPPTFSINNTDYAEIICEGWSKQRKNILRRILLSRIPSPAIDLLEIYENQTILQDETLGLRLSLIPVQVEKIKFEMLYSWNFCFCSKKGCNSCCLKGTLFVENQTTCVKEITTNDLILPDGCKIAYSSPVLLFHLHPRKRVHIEFNIQKGVGADHIKWIPVGSVSTHKDNLITFENNKMWSNQHLIDTAYSIMEKEYSDI